MDKFCLYQTIMISCPDRTAVPTTTREVTRLIGHYCTTMFVRKIALKDRPSFTLHIYTARDARDDPENPCYYHERVPGVPRPAVRLHATNYPCACGRAA